MAANNEHEEKKDNVQLRREFGLLQGVAVIVGLVIGSGIYVAPTGVLRQVPSAGVALILWAIAGFVSTLGALTFAELGTTIPVAGEKYAYLKVMYGDFPAFEQLWQYFLLLRPCANVLKGIVFATYILKPFFPDCETPKIVIALIAICLLALFIWINSVNVRLSAQVQTVFTSMTVFTLLIVIIISWVHIGKGNIEFLSPSYAFEGLDKLSANKIVLGLYAAIFPYGGWFALNFMIEELKNPYKNLPRAVVTSMAIICGIYISVNIAYFATLGVEGVIASEAVVISFGLVTMGKWAIWLFAIVIAVNNLGSLNSGILVGSRLVFAGARNGHLPRVLGLIHTTHRTPIPAILLQFSVAIFMCIFVDILDLINQMVSVALFFNFLTTVGMIQMRYKKPHLKRPIKMPIIIPVTYAFLTFSMLVIALITAPRETGIGLLIVVGTSMPYYLLFVTRIVRFQIVDKYADKFLILTQKTLNAVPQEGEIGDNSD